MKCVSGLACLPKGFSGKFSYRGEELEAIAGACVKVWWLLRVCAVDANGCHMFSSGGLEAYGRAIRVQMRLTCTAEPYVY